MRRLFTMFAKALSVLSVVAGMLLMHPFEAVRPAPFATHAVHESGDPAGPVVAVGLCVFVAALAVTALTSLLFMGSVFHAVRPPRRAQAASKLPGLRGPPDGFSYELRVIRV